MPPEPDSVSANTHHQSNQFARGESVDKPQRQLCSGYRITPARYVSRLSTMPGNAVSVRALSSTPNLTRLLDGYTYPPTNRKPGTIALGTADLDGLSSSPCDVISTFAWG